VAADMFDTPPFLLAVRPMHSLVIATGTLRSL
jgi:hypothetical protein